MPRPAAGAAIDTPGEFAGAIGNCLVHAGRDVEEVYVDGVISLMDCFVHFDVLFVRKISTMIRRKFASYQGFGIASIPDLLGSPTRLARSR